MSAGSCQDFINVIFLPRCQERQTCIALQKTLRLALCSQPPTQQLRCTFNRLLVMELH